jgi:predicted RNase H-like nuclease
MTRVIAIDCAVQPEKTGLVLAETDGALVHVHAVRTGKGTDVAALVAEWLAGTETALLALDAPLGWPAPLGAWLATHVAGGAASGHVANELFRRVTDRHIHATLGKLPLEVGADRIARTAHAALALLDAVRAHTGHAIPLAWTPGTVVGVQAIEVYPAATRRAYGADRARGALTGFETRLQFVAPAAEPAADETDQRDALLCAVAAADFLRGAVMAPTDAAMARREGWIWAAPPGGEEFRVE